jgi:lysophospholipase L1-like esterase
VLSLLAAAVIFTTCASPPPNHIILCAGDSITESPYPRTLQRELRREGFRVKVINRGVSGHTSGEYLRYLRQNIESFQKAAPDFVLLQLGTNDVRLDADNTPLDRFDQNMREIIDIFRGIPTRKGNPPTILLATVPPIPTTAQFPFTEESSERIEKEINPAIEAICREENLTLVDNFELFRKAAHLLPDVHPTQEGYRILAGNWSKALKPLL